MFTPPTRTWFRESFLVPTPVQAAAWRAVASGGHALVVAPTGSGKTLAAFLWAVDQLASRSAGRDGQVDDQVRHRCRVVYVSPLKALAVDVERNLRRPLAGITASTLRHGGRPPQITVGLRTGDTPAADRRAFARTPPDILITTPESLYLLLTSAARESLRGVTTVIVDEVHAVCATKRGVHLALSLERLDALLAAPAQRIGLSATVRPAETVARFLGGAAEVQIVQPPADKTIDLSVQVPVPDLTRLDETPAPTPTPGPALADPTPGPALADPTPGQALADPARRASIWPAVEARVFELIRSHRSTIVFTNSRRTAERLCTRLNELALVTPPTPSTRPPAEVIAQSPTALGAPPLIARAHHGSVSREERRLTEEALKSGQLPAVVATSSLELGIDMGAVDLVIQVESPPSVASGLQRIGRSGHQVNAVSKGVIFPKHRGDLISCAVVAERMRAGEIEELRYPRHPLDVLAQQIVAMVAMDPWPVEALTELVHRAAPFAELPRSALHGVLNMLAGHYPATAFGQLSPRLVWDRAKDVLTGRPGAQRLAVTSGGTIPDRGLYGVFLANSAGGKRTGGVRVGELDEEMVYESRVGDVFLLGSTSWRIMDITADRVLVIPAPGTPARMPFWKGDTPGRPLELGRAIGAAIRRHGSGAGPESRALAARDLSSSGLDPWAVDNLLGYLAEQRAATGRLPDDQTIVVERFRDELGDWRLVVHCVLGARVNAPWALAVAERVAERYGLDGQVMPADDGLVIRLPDLASPPGAELVLFEPDEIGPVVERAVGGSALFAARFRECAARALLLPRRDPRRRQPLWQQRHRAGQLLEVARAYPEFPITLEAARECLTDLFDLPGLVRVLSDIAARTTSVVEVTTQRPSPFARSLLFGYVGAFLYDGDAPLAERRTAALTLDPTMLCELLGRVELRELLDPTIVAEAEPLLQWLTPARTPRDAEDVAEMLRLLGELSEPEAIARGVDPLWLRQLAEAGRAILVVVAGEARWLAVEDAARVRDGLGVRLPEAIPPAFLEPVADPLGDLLARYASCHGPFRAGVAARRFDLEVAAVERSLGSLARRGMVVPGQFTADAAGDEWCDAQVLRHLRRRSLAALRREIEPVPAPTLVRFLPAWQRVGPDASPGPEALVAAVEQLRGATVAASALESLVLPARVCDYSPTYLDELCASGEVIWCGAGALSGSDGWVTLAFPEDAPLLLPQPAPEAFFDRDPYRWILRALDGGRALFFRALADQVATAGGQPVSESRLVEAIWELVWAGLLSSDTLAPLRARLAGAGVHHPPRRPVRPRLRYARSGLPRLAPDSPAGSRPVPPTVAGRWYRLPDREADPTRRATAVAGALLERHGVLTGAAFSAEGIPGGFATGYRVLAAMEERGIVRRGYFVEGLGAAQFALPGAVDRLRALSEEPESSAQRGQVLILAATDPANPYGVTLGWPQPDGTADSAVPGAHRPGRRAGALVALAGGRLILYVERGGRTLLSYSDDHSTLVAAAGALAEAVRSAGVGGLSVERADGEPVHASRMGEILTAAGFRVTPRGLRSA
jgi:ATP-dependent Lhr-like helicase